MKGDLRLPSKSQIAHEILAYLAEHPDSQDTFEGIVQWWLLERKIKYQKDLVKEALEELISRNLINEVQLRGTKVRYQIKQQIRGEVRNILRKEMQHNHNNESLDDPAE